jgi:hypothetical protein
MIKQNVSEAIKDKKDQNNNSFTNEFSVSIFLANCRAKKSINLKPAQFINIKNNHMGKYMRKGTKLCV